MKLEDFTRVIYVSQEAENVWKPRITRITQALRWLEIETVVRGIRRGALIFCSNDELIEISRNLSMIGLVAVPLEVQGMLNTYASSFVPPVNGLPINWRVIVTDLNSFPEFANYWRGRDDIGIGKFLGFPKCCLDFFQRYWINEHYVDTSWPMVEAESKSKKVILYKYLDSCNILLRWLGVRSVFHLPCSFNCNATDLLAESHFELLEKDRPEELEWLQELLAWPIQWSALHGIAEIKTPICNISTRSDSTEETYTIQLMGKTYPIEGVRGNKFPYTESQKVRDVWTANGFKSKASMDKAHSDLVSLVKAKNPHTVLDMGCGNGELLRKIGAPYSVGIEVDSVRYQEALHHYPKGVYYNCSIDDFRVIQKYDVILISSNRFTPSFTEYDNIEKLKKFCKELIIYSYDDGSIGAIRGNL